MKVLMATVDLEYLPLPNVSELVLSTEAAPEALTRTAFAIAFTQDKRAVMANNRRRGLEFAGGHRDPVLAALVSDVVLEDYEVAAGRELFEETGCKAAVLVPLAYQRNTCNGEVPEGYGYPFPTSYQQFMVGMVAEVAEFEETDECLHPVFVGVEDAEGLLRPSQYCLFMAAYDAVFGTDPLPEFAGVMVP